MNLLNLNTLKGDLSYFYLIFSVDGLIDQALVGADNLQKIRTDADLGNATYLYSILSGISRMG
jgi:hypothetical protein